MNNKQEKLFKKEYALELLRIAQGDYQSAAALASTQLGRPENILLLAQQGLEKSLKAVLCWHGKKVPLVHEIGTLLAKFPDEWNPPFGYELEQLSQFASIRRYLEGSEHIDFDEIVATLEVVKKAMDWCAEQVSASN